MTVLPIAAPGYTGGVMLVNIKRCWANRKYRAAGMGQCSVVVEEDDELGLCADHIEELREHSCEGEFSAATDTPREVRPCLPN